MHSIRGENNSNFTDTTSRLEGQEMTELGIESFTATNTPPPRELLSLRYNVNFEGEISTSNIESDKQVSVTQIML